VREELGLRPWQAPGLTEVGQVDQGMREGVDVVARRAERIEPEPGGGRRRQCRAWSPLPAVRSRIPDAAQPLELELAVRDAFTPPRSTRGQRPGEHFVELRVRI